MRIARGRGAASIEFDGTITTEVPTGTVEAESKGDITGVGPEPPFANPNTTEEDAELPFKACIRLLRSLEETDQAREGASAGLEAEGNHTGQTRISAAKASAEMGRTLRRR